MDNQKILHDKGRHNTGESRRCLNILVAEDNLMIQEIIRCIFDSVDCCLNMAVNGKKALEVLGKNNYDLILMDLQMPEMNGFEATACIRAMERETGGHIPILAMTGYPLENGRKNCIDMGMDDYLVKPFDIWELFEIIERLTHIKLNLDPASK